MLNLCPFPKTVNSCKMFSRESCFGSFIFWEVKPKTEFLENPKMMNQQSFHILNIVTICGNKTFAILTWDILSHHLKCQHARYINYTGELFILS